MNKMCLAHLGLFLLALHLLSSQVIQAETTTGPLVNGTSMNTSMSMPGNPTMGTMNVTSSDKNGVGSIDAFTILLPLAVTASLLHGWSQ